MAREETGTSSPKGGADAPKTAGTSSLSEDFVPNEPTHKSGTDAEGKPDGTLGSSQVGRAANEALLSLSPQPSVDEITKVLAGLIGQKFKTASDAGKAAVDALNKLRG